MRLVQTRNRDSDLEGNSRHHMLTSLLTRYLTRDGLKTAVDLKAFVATTAGRDRALRASLS